MNNLFLTILTSPFNLLFLIIIAGIAVGKIRICRISLGISGILFVAIFIGFLVDLLASEDYIETVSGAQRSMETFSKLGSSLFVSVIGLQTGASVKSNSKGSLISFAIGAFMNICGVMLMLLISAFDSSVSHTSLLGVLCGALTSTPGLSSVCELIESGSEEAVCGYGCSYLFGVLFAVLFAQLLSRNMHCGKPEPNDSTVPASKIYPELILISIAALSGNILGSIRIPFLNISIGNTAGTLLTGSLAGYVVKGKIAGTQISSQVMNVCRNLGLALFFSGTGFTTGIRSVTLDIKNVLYGVLITLGVILFGILLCMATASRHRLHRGAVIAGGMTSSPAYGALTQKSGEKNVDNYAFAYFGALLSLIIALQIMVKFGCWA